MRVFGWQTRMRKEIDVRHHGKGLGQTAFAPWAGP
jgi:hypothetical protein